jgi:hypothetical protein
VRDVIYFRAPFCSPVSCFFPLYDDRSRRWTETRFEEPKARVAFHSECKQNQGFPCYVR